MAEREETKEGDEKRKEQLIALVGEIVPSQMKHHAEAEACDLLMEVERLDLIHKFVDAQSYQVTSRHFFGVPWHAVFISPFSEGMSLPHVLRALRPRPREHEPPEDVDEDISRPKAIPADNEARSADQRQ